MKIVIGYEKIVKSFRHKRKEVFVPIYKEVGKGSSKDKFASKEIRRET